jgi:hypothetical protein
LAGLPNFLGTTYQNGCLITGCPLNVPKGHKIYRKATKFAHLFPFPSPPKYTQIGEFWYENIPNLATLCLGRRKTGETSRVARFFFGHDTKTGKNAPNEQKMYQMFIKYRYHVFSSKDVSAKDVSSNDVSSKKFSSKDVSSNDFSSKYHFRQKPSSSKMQQNSAPLTTFRRMRRFAENASPNLTQGPIFINFIIFYNFYNFL